MASPCAMSATGSADVVGRHGRVVPPDGAVVREAEVVVLQGRVGEQQRELAERLRVEGDLRAAFGDVGEVPLPDLLAFEIWADAAVGDAEAPWRAAWRARAASSSWPRKFAGFVKKRCDLRGLLNEFAAGLEKRTPTSTACCTSVLNEAFVFRTASRSGRHFRRLQRSGE
jgi:hypothetical protein